jgi:hypothetical protein
MGRQVGDFVEVLKAFPQAGIAGMADYPLAVQRLIAVAIDRGALGRFVDVEVQRIVGEVPDAGRGLAVLSPSGSAVSRQRI